MSAVLQMPYGCMPDGRQVQAFKLSGGSDFSVTVSDLGASIIGLVTPDIRGVPADIILGCETAWHQAIQTDYLGAAIGRVAGRIGDAVLPVGNTIYRLERNAGQHHLHGGSAGFAHQLWSWRILDSASPQIEFLLTSEDGHMGYPGALSVSVSYRLEPDGRLVVTFSGTSNRTTPFNPTSHAYFNLDGHDSGSVNNHVLQLFASRYTPVGPELIPTGAIEPVARTTFDFRVPRAIAKTAHTMQDGYDTNYVLDGVPNRLRCAAVLSSRKSGRTLTVETDRPCIHLYTGGGLDVAGGKDGAHYRRFDGLALETQGYPDAPNHPAFPGSMLEPGKAITGQTIFKFGTNERP